MLLEVQGSPTVLRVMNRDNSASWADIAEEGESTGKEDGEMESQEARELDEDQINEDDVGSDGDTMSKSLVSAVPKHTSTFLSCYPAPPNPASSHGPSNSRKGLISSALDCESNVAKTITVDKSGTGNFVTIQGAIDSVPSNNNQWIRIFVKPGIYIERVMIDQHKPCILLQGASRTTTIIQDNAHDAINTSATFTLRAENFVAKNIGFKNTYNLEPPSGGPKRIPVVAARIIGDKASFHSCGFFGLQDTLWDQHGRHFFNQCYIQGAVDFIFGAGQSIYEGCIVNVTARGLQPSNDVAGYITAQRRNSSDDPSGFVFKNSNVVGNGLAYLGRAWGPYSRVIFVKSFLSQVVVPQGWDAWSFIGHEQNFMYAESDCTGPGSDTSKRVTWEKKISDSELKDFTQISFINKEGWIEKQP
ncbi:hypothetical protein NE237_002080 [Protea cynaroides]|uniref:Pectinesterase n=1 Tax=Protea cynaroides TaxID=273540 RepID=A0A9Q0KVE3_9MAGN|nr:hypothetical protein NE237_002080 [Protea cynaroides]